MSDFLPHVQRKLSYNKPVKVLLISDPKNALNPLGKTAHYEPSTFTVTVYVDERHPKDIMRSLSHELVHHAQNCRGEFDDASGVGESGYTQTDKHLREMEREAYETGNLIFRDYEDGLKTKQKQNTIYIKLMKEGFQPMNTRRQLIERTIKKVLMEKGVDPAQFPNPLPDEDKEGFLDKGLEDGDPSDDVVETSGDSAPAGKLSPSQSAIYLSKALGFVVGGVCGGDLKAIVSGDNFILDGHHRWAATVFCNPTQDVEFQRSMLPITELIPVLRATGDAYGNDRRGVPEGGDINIFQATIEDALTVVQKLNKKSSEYFGPGDAEKWFLELGGGDKDAAVKVLDQRLQMIKKKAPGGKVPDRINMPVIDAKKGEVSDVTKRLNKGQIDVRAPYAEPQKGKKTMKETNFRSRLREIVSRHLNEEETLAWEEDPHEITEKAGDDAKVSKQRSEVSYSPSKQSKKAYNKSQRQYGKKQSKEEPTTMKETNFRSRIREIVSRHLKEVTAGQTALAGFEEVRNQWKEDTVDNANIDALLAALKQHVTPAMEQLGLSDIDLPGKLASQGVISYTSANEEVYIDPDGAMGKYDVEIHTYDGYHGQHYNHSHNTMGEVIQYAQETLAPEGKHTSPGEDPRQQELPLKEWEVDLAPPGSGGGGTTIEEKSKELDRRIAFIQDNWRDMAPDEVDDQHEIIDNLYNEIQAMKRETGEPTTMKESKRDKRTYNERTGLLMERMLGIANLEPIGGGNWLFEEEEEETEDEPDVSYPEDSFLSSQEAQKETEGAEEDENYTKSELEDFTKRPDDLKNQ